MENTSGNENNIDDGKTGSSSDINQSEIRIDSTSSGSPSLGSDSSGETVRKSRSGKRRNPAATSGNSASIDGGGSSGRTVSRKEKGKKEIDNLSSQAGFICFIVAAALKTPELNLSKEEATKLAEEYIKMSEAYGWELSIDPRWAATFSMLVTMGTIFLPKIAKSNHRKNEEKRIALEQKKLKEQELINNSLSENPLI